MVTILGFDPSKSTGFCVYDPAQAKLDRNFSHIQCGVFEVPEKADAYYTADQIALQTRNLIQGLIKEGRRPAFAILEEAAGANIGKVSAKAMIYAWASAGAIVGVLANFAIPYGTLMPNTWRKAYFGSNIPPLDANGKKDWKASAIAQCQRDGIKLPKQKALAHNAAEACALAICWSIKSVKLHAGRYHQPWLDLQMRRNERAPARSMDLFQEDAA